MSVGNVTQTGSAKPIKTRSIKLPAQLLKAAVLVCFVLLGLVAVLLVSIIGYEIAYQGKIHRGVQVWGLDLGGKRPEAARSALSQRFDTFVHTPWKLRDHQRTWTVTPAALGVRFDTASTVSRAYEVGRSGSLAWNLGEQLRSASQGMPVAPVVLYDELAAQRYLQEVAAEIDQPVRNASLSVRDLEIYEAQPQVGRELDIPATLQAVRQAAHHFTPAEIQLVVKETLPRVIDASIARDQARAIIAEPLTLYLEGESPVTTEPDREEAAPDQATELPLGPWQLGREDLAAMLVIGEAPVGEGGGMRFTAALDQAALTRYLAPIAQTVSSTAKSARFILDDDTRQLEVIAPSTEGRELDIEATLARINAQVTDTNRQVPLVMRTIPAEFNESTTAEALGITELIASSTSYFAGSSSGRANNVAVAASKFHGIIVKPGETFSFNQWLGEVTEEEGYDESLIIFGNETIPDVGGGICQVSTTAFRAAFWAGFPITERWAHAYRVGYYEQGNQPVGFDATIYSPLVDLKFVNESPYHLLIETYINRNTSSLTYKFYSTGDGRVVELEGPVVTDVIEHGDPVYREDPDLAPGEIKQIEWATNGLTAIITRVIRDAETGDVIERKEFKSKFRPWDAVYLVGPGTEVPGYDVIRLEEQDAESDSG
jgi:vancomycin resistance protein YoaR